MSDIHKSACAAPDCESPAPVDETAAWLCGPAITLRVVSCQTRLGSPITDSRKAVQYVRRSLLYRDRELMLMVPLNTRHQPIGLHLVSVGSLSASVVHPREVFKAAILVNAAAILLAHNHPGGDPRPSSEDKNLTQRLKAGGDLLGISLLDHLILVDSGSYFSFLDEHML